MGLDMYLTKKTYVGAEYEHRNVEAKIEITIGGKAVKIDPKRITYIQERAGYWRKANAIHKWFVDNVQKGEDDCREYYVSREQLKKLLGLCWKVKNLAVLEPGVVENGYTITQETGRVPNFEMGQVVKNQERIHELLPTQEGFFFGNTDYNHWYMQDIEETIEILNSALAEEGDDAEFYYQASW